MTPNIAHIAQPAMGAYFAGADAISAINTIKSVTLGDESEVCNPYRAHKNATVGWR